MSSDFSWFTSLVSTLWGWMFIALLLGGSIFVHELGHFLAARWRGLKVDRFSIGFGPKIFSWKGKDGVEYRLSWLPLGGYVALPQLADMRGIEGDPSADIRALPPISYLDKMITVTAGVVFNMIFALALSLLLWGVGVPWPSATDTQVVGYVFPTMETLKNGTPAYQLPPSHIPRDEPFDPSPAPAAKAGLLPGDRILAVDGHAVENFRDLPEAVALSSGRDEKGNPQVTITYERDGVTKDVKVFPALVPTNLRSGDVIREIGLMPAEKLVIGNLSNDSPAIAGGMQKGDEILAVNGQKVFSTAQLNDLINQSGGSPIVFNIRRDDKPMDLTIHPARVPRTTPLATITVAAATLDILPIYKANDSADPASPATTAEKLLIWNVDNRNSAFSSLRSGDYLLKVNGQAVTSVQQVVDALIATPAGQAPSLLIDSETTHANLTVPLPATATAAVTPSEMFTRIGIDGWKDDAAPVHPTPLAQFSHAFNQIFGMLGALFNSHSNIGVQHLSGPIGISRMIYQLSIEDVRLALWFAFIINVNLAILNLLPIPVLDGGHILFFTIARLRRRELPLSFISAAQGICLVLIMSLVLYVFINDSRRWGGENDLEKEALHNSYYFLDQENIKFSPAPANTSASSNAAAPAAATTQ